MRTLLAHFTRTLGAMWKSSERQDLALLLEEVTTSGRSVAR